MVRVGFALLHWALDCLQEQVQRVDECPLSIEGKIAQDQLMVGSISCPRAASVAGWTALTARTSIYVMHFRTEKKRSELDMFDEEKVILKDQPKGGRKIKLKDR